MTAIAIDAVLARLIAEYGPALAGDEARLRGLLLDECHGDRQAVNLVLDARAEGVADDLAKAGDGPLEALIPRLAERLVAHRGAEPAAARWAVTAWARALGHRAVPMPPAPSESRDNDLRNARASVPAPAGPAAATVWSATPRWLKIFGTALALLGAAAVFFPGGAPESVGPTRGTIAANAGLIAMHPATRDGAPAREISIPVAVRGARGQRCEVQTWWYYRNGSRVTARVTNTGFASPNGQIARMAYFTPGAQDDSREVRVAYPLAVFPERDFATRAEYDLVASLECGGRLLADRIRRPVIEGAS